VTSENTLMGGTVRLVQAQSGHRSGIEPVLLASIVPARPGQRILEGGTGVGAGLLCLAHRVPGIEGIGIEMESATAALARANFEMNAASGLAVLEGDLEHVAADGVFDHAMANPPWHNPAATHSPDPTRALARHARPGLMAVWARQLAQGLRHRGTLSFITGAGTLSECLAAFTEAGCGSHVVVPLWPRAGREAKLVLLQGVRGGRAATRVLPGLVLHGRDGGYTEAADAVLRGGAMLSTT
jgi:tRNA1Val (adenine37-N6)-methyltransferase